MFLQDLFASLKRRWYFIVVGILITAAVAYFAYGETPVKYQATGSVALVPPPTAVISGDNPFLYMGGLEQALGVLTVKLNSPEVKRPILEQFPDIEYTTTRDPSTNGPIVLVSVTGSTSAETLGALEEVLAAVPANLGVLQDTLKLSQESKMTSMPLSSDEKATVNNSARTRTLLFVAAAGAAATLLLTGQLDKILLRRRSAKASRRGGARSADAGDSETPDGGTKERRSRNRKQQDTTPDAPAAPAAPENPDEPVAGPSAPSTTPAPARVPSSGTPARRGSAPVKQGVVRERVHAQQR